MWCGVVAMISSSNGSSCSVSSIASIGSCRVETNAVDGNAGGVRTCGSVCVEHALGGLGLDVALGMGRVPLGGGGVRDEEADLDRAAVRPRADGVEQGRRGRDAVGDHQDAGGARGFHRAPQGDARGWDRLGRMSFARTT